jgi:YggT family protein
MNNAIVIVVQTIGQILTVIVIIDAVLSFIVAPDHPIRAALGQILQPLYAPIRRFMPAMGGLDFTPIVLLLLIRAVVWIVTSIFT